MAWTYGTHQIFEDFYIMEIKKIFGNRRNWRKYTNQLYEEIGWRNYENWLIGLGYRLL